MNKKKIKPCDQTFNPVKRTNDVVSRCDLIAQSTPPLVDPHSGHQSIILSNSFCLTSTHSSHLKSPFLQLAMNGQGSIGKWSSKADWGWCNRVSEQGITRKFVEVYGFGGFDNILEVEDLHGKMILKLVEFGEADGREFSQGS